MTNLNWATGEGYPDGNSSSDVWQYEFLIRSKNGLKGHEHFRLGGRNVEFFVGPLIIPIEEDGSLQNGPDARRSNINRMVLMFCLDHNIDTQLEKAREWLLNTQAIRYDDDKRRKRTDKYQIYLRAFDGFLLGATQDQIAAALYPKFDNLYPDFPMRKQISKDLKAANKLVRLGVLKRHSRK